MSREEEKKLLEEFKARQFADNSKELIEVIREDEDMEEALICLLMDDGGAEGEWLRRLRRDVHTHLSRKFADSIADDDDDEEFDPSIGWRVWE